MKTKTYSRDMWYVPMSTMVKSSEDSDDVVSDDKVEDSISDGETRLIIKDTTRDEDSTPDEEEEKPTADDLKTDPDEAKEVKDKFEDIEKEIEDGGDSDSTDADATSDIDDESDDSDASLDDDTGDESSDSDENEEQKEVDDSSSETDDDASDDSTSEDSSTNSSQSEEEYYLEVDRIRISRIRDILYRRDGISVEEYGRYTDVINDISGRRGDIDVISIEERVSPRGKMIARVESLASMMGRVGVPTSTIVTASDVALPASQYSTLSNEEMSSGIASKRYLDMLDMIAKHEKISLPKRHHVTMSDEDTTDDSWREVYVRSRVTRGYDSYTRMIVDIIRDVSMKMVARV